MNSPPYVEVFVIRNFLSGFSSPIESHARLSSNYRHAQRRAERPIVDVDAEFAAYDGREFRHRITGEVRYVARSTRSGHAYFCRHGANGFYRPIRKALSWLRNADEVRA